MIVYKEELHTSIKLNTSYRVKYVLFYKYVDCKGRTFNKFCLFFISKKIRGPPFWFELAKKQIQIGGIKMKEDRKYYIKLDDKQLVEVTNDIYTVYYQMRRRERYNKLSHFLNLFLLNSVLFFSFDSKLYIYPLLPRPIVYHLILCNIFYLLSFWFLRFEFVFFKFKPKRRTSDFFRNKKRQNLLKVLPLQSTYS